MVAELQRMLDDLGYDAGPADGAFGSRTVQALISFERDHGQPPSTELSAAALAAVRSVWYDHNRAAAAGSAAVNPTVSRPSFDCARAAAPSEREICANPPLAQLDSQVASAFAAAKARAPAQQQAKVEAEQLEWLRRRNACGADASCLERMIGGRLGQLQTNAAIAGTAGNDVAAMVQDTPAAAAASNPAPATVAADQARDTAAESPQPQPPAVSSPQRSIVGEWTGGFTCDNVEDNAFDLTVTHSASGLLDATLSFTLKNRPDGAGRITLRGGAPGADGQFTLAPQEWIERPSGFNPFGLMGQVAGNDNTVTGKLLGCGSTAFVAHRKAVPGGAVTAAAAPENIEPPVAGGPLEGLWQGASVCSQGNQSAVSPMTVTVSQQDSALAALVTEPIPDPRTHAPRDLQGIFLSEAVGGGGALRGGPNLGKGWAITFPNGIQPDNVGSIRAGFYAPICKASLSRKSGYPGGFGHLAEGLLGAWSTPPSNYAEEHPRRGLTTILPDTAVSLQFRRKGDLLYGRLQAFFPVSKPPSDRDHLSVDLRPIVTTADGQIGFVSTRVLRAEGTFASGKRSPNMLAQGIFLLVAPPKAEDRELQVSLSAGLRCCAAEPDMLFLRREEAEVAQIAAGGVPAELPPGIGGRLAAARSLQAQCDALEEWSRPLTARTDAETQIIDRLEPEAVPLFDDDAFVPVFGLPYIAMSAAQLKPVFYLLIRDCPQKLGKRDLNHTLLYAPFSGPEGSFGYAAVTSALMNRRAAKATVGEAEQRLPALPATDAGLAELGKLEHDTASSVALLAEKERQAFAAALAENRTRIARGILETRVSAVSELPPTQASLDQLDKLIADISASALPADEKTGATSTVDDRAQAIVAALVAEAGQRAVAAPPSLQGLAVTRAVIAEIDALKQRASKYGGSAPEPDSGPAIARRAAILADAGVQRAFRDAMLDVAHASASPDTVRSAAARLLRPEEIGASPYRASTDEAMRRAEQEHRSRVLGTDAAEEPASVSGEPAAGDMLDALEALASEIDAGQDYVASSCERGGVRNDPLLALMCLVQMGAGGPMHVHVAHFRKIGCKKATENPGYMCDYTFSLDVASGRNMGILGEMLAAGGNCTGRFVQAGGLWLLRDRECD